jgi:plasmid stabilization system protein ParE
VAQVRWTVGAVQDLRGIVEFIGRDSLAYAESTAARILEAVGRLASQPRLGRLVPEYRDRNLRELIVGNYRIVYRASGQQVSVIAVIHGSRDLVARLRDRPWLIP